MLKTREIIVMHLLRFSVLALVSLSYLTPAVFGQASENAQAASSQEAGSSEVVTGQTSAVTNWLDRFLADELQYDADQIAQFKQNVADMPEADLKKMLQRMRLYRDSRKEMQHLRLATHERSVARRDNAVATARPKRPAMYGVSQPRVRSYHRRPGGMSLFRGYFVRVGRY